MKATTEKITIFIDEDTLLPGEMEEGDIYDPDEPDTEEA